MDAVTVAPVAEPEPPAVEPDAPAAGPLTPEDLVEGAVVAGLVVCGVVPAGDVGVLDDVRVGDGAAVDVVVGDEGVVVVVVEDVPVLGEVVVVVGVALIEVLVADAVPFCWIDSLTNRVALVPVVSRLAVEDADVVDDEYLDSSEDSWSSAAMRVFSACIRVRRAAVGSSVASNCPFRTAWPTLT